MTQEQIDQMQYLVGHHHTFVDIQGIDYQILVEADSIANGGKNAYLEINVRKTFSTRLLRLRQGRN